MALYPDSIYKRRVLMPPAQGRNEFWNYLADAIDEVFYTLGIDPGIKSLSTIRQPFTINDMVLQDSVNQNKLISLAQLYATYNVQELETLILAANQLGFRFPQSDIFNQDDFLRIVRFVSEYYWEDKGLESWQDFLGFALNAQFQVLNTWTENYMQFYDEGDPIIGTPIYEGGTWYPTTHVVLEYDITKFAGNHAYVVDFFYYFANINLVLWAIRLTQTAYMDPLNAVVDGTMTVIY